MIDTTGAGDSFCSGFLRIYLETGNIAKALAFGNVCGGLCVQQMGGIIQDLTLEKVERIIRNLEKSQSSQKKSQADKTG
ncbi:PfkB family carbohydrate kinase [Mesotoga sp.]|uniref:PfkB family carbohydrate kinase n=1 Tax=Mesotoga sp. TaxID=2053577 RepID=UPI00345E973B